MTNYWFQTFNFAKDEIHEEVCMSNDMSLDYVEKWLLSKGWYRSGNNSWDRFEKTHKVTCISLGMAFEHQLNLEQKSKFNKIRPKFREYYLSNGGVKSMLEINKSLDEYCDTEVQNEFETFCAGYFSAVEEIS